MKCLRFCAVLMAAAFASASAFAQCPAYGAPGCNETITINADGSFTVAGIPANGVNYDGSDDVLVGITNNSSTAVTSITLNGNGVGIFGFDADGIDTFGAPGNGMDSTGYGGPNSYFSNISPDFTMGTVNFINALAANGGNTYFSLEESFDPSNPPTPGGGGGGGSVTPEPSTLVLLGTGALGAAGSIRRRFLKK